MTKKSPSPHREYQDRLQRFQKLMARRVQNLLLVASPYDSYILEEEGQLDELILNEFTDVSLRNAPAMRRVSSGAEALRALREEAADLVITTGNLGDMSLERFLREAKTRYPRIPVVLLAFDTLQPVSASGLEDLLAGVFVWQGDFRILMAIVKHIEDRWNVDADTQRLGVGAIILIEDSVHYYSSFLPVFYGEIMSQSQRVITEGMNLTNKVMRMRARPKVLLATTYEEAWDYYERYHRYVMGLFSDVEFPREGKQDPHAGLDFAKRVREANPDLPIMLHTQDPTYLERAHEVEADVVLKNSPVLLHELRRFMLTNFGFGDFVFRMNDEEVGRAKDLRMLEELLHTVPAESILQHAERNHFSIWLKARTEFALAEILRRIKATDFESAEDIRGYLIESIHEFRQERQSGAIALFDPDQFNPEVSLSKIGTGSMGGKARGLAFLRRLLYNYRIRNRVPGVRIFVPSALVLSTDVFDQFLDGNDLRDVALHESDDAALERRFTEARFPKRALNRVKRFLEKADYPLAVRSSSLLEDSQYQPFAGIYSTFMVPNNDPNPRNRLRSLLTAVKRIYASTFFQRSKEYIRTSSYRLEEEKMGVIIQRMVGTHHGRFFYPDFSGVAQSYNYYPTAPAVPDDGIVAVALGLGQKVVEGGEALRFCPRYPRHLPQFADPADIVRNSQSRFYALDLADPTLQTGEHVGLSELEIEVARSDGALDDIASVYSHENNVVYDGLGRAGSPLVTFSPILKYNRFPLAQITEMLLDVGRRGMNSPVVMEFAVNLKTEPKEFACLQMRPLVIQQERGEFRHPEDEEEVLCWSTRVLGSGVVDTVRDVILVDRDGFDRAQSRDAAAQVAEFNARLLRDDTPYILIGVGRWGASDPWLGIPVMWEQIMGAKVIVEAGFREVRVAPSQGSHFFHNLTAASIGYFSVDFESGDGRVDWEWLRGQPEAEADGFVRHLRFEDPLEVVMQGHKGRGFILKPRPRES